MNDCIAGIIDTESSAASSSGEGEQDNGQSAQSSSSHDNSDQLIADSVRGIAPGGAQRGARGQDRRGARQRGRGRGAGRAVWRGRRAARGRGANRTHGRGGVRGRGHAPCTQTADPVVTNSWDDTDDGAPAYLGNFHPSREPVIQIPDGFLPTGPLDFFKLFFPVAVVQSIAKFTNVYADQHILNYPDFGDKYGAWAETSADEIYLFMALMIFRGIVHLSDMKRYWSTATVYNGLWARRFIPSRKRFQSLLVFLHVTHPDHENPADKLRKVRFLYDHL